MGAQHTPGPWAVQEPMDHELWIVEDGKEAYEWRVIAGLPWPSEKGDIARKQVEANARLIAASPDMLEALEQIDGEAPATEPSAKRTVGFDNISDDPDPLNEVVDEAFQEGVVRGMWLAAQFARAALAKARGQS